MTLTEQLRRRRMELYMTQKGVAKLLGLTGAAMSYREQHDGDHIKDTVAWAKALGLDLRAITEGSSVICKNCREQVHEDCPGGTWCDCGHRSTVMVPQQVAFIGHPGAGVSTVADKVTEEEDLRQAKIRAGVRLMERLAELPESVYEGKYTAMLKESLNLLHMEGLREAIEQRYAADELAREGQEYSFQ